MGSRSLVFGHRDGPRTAVSRVVGDAIFVTETVDFGGVNLPALTDGASGV